MATATALKKTFKKVTEALTDNGEPIVYFIDERAIREWERQYHPVAETGTAFLKIWKDVTKFPIQDIARLDFARKEPVKLFREEYKTANEEKLLQFMGLDIDISSLIKLPEDFDRVTTAAKQLNRWAENIDLNKNFAIEGNEVVITDAAYERRNRKAYYTAETPAEKRNLQIAEEIRDAMEKLAELVPPMKKLGAEAISNKRYAHPLPYPLKLANTKSGTVLIPNPVFVKNGFAGTTILGFYLETTKDVEFAKRDAVHRIGPRMKRIQVIGEDGFPTRDYVICPPEDVDKYAWGPGRVRKNIVLDGYVNIEGQPFGTPLKGDTAIGATSFADKILKHSSVQD